MTSSTTAHPVQATTRPLISIVLLANAAFSFASGAILALGAVGLDSWLGVEAWILAVLGVGLTGYGALVYFWATHADWYVRGGESALVGDVAWIIAAVALIVFTDVLTTEGEWALALVSVPVAAFADGEWIGLRRVRRT